MAYFQQFVTTIFINTQMEHRYSISANNGIDIFNWLNYSWLYIVALDYEYNETCHERPWQGETLPMQ